MTSSLLLSLFLLQSGNITGPAGQPQSGRVIVDPTPIPIDDENNTAPLTVTLPAAMQEGTTSMTASASGPPPPVRHVLGTPPVYYNVENSAAFLATSDDPMSVCIDYRGIAFMDETAVALVQYESNEWVDRTSLRDDTNKRVCASVTTLGTFALVEPANARPQAHAGPDQSVGVSSAAGTVVTLNGAATYDPDREPIEIEWRDASGTVVGTTLKADHTVPPGAHQFTLTARDPRGGTATDAVVVIVNRAPAASVTTTAVCSIGCAVTFTASATDSDGGPLAYRWTGCGISDGPTLTCIQASAGTVQASVTVTDAVGAAAKAQAAVPVVVSAFTAGAWSACAGSSAYTCTSNSPTGCSRPGSQSRTANPSAWSINPAAAVTPPTATQTCTESARGYVAAYSVSYAASWTCTAAGTNGCYKDRLSYAASSFRVTGPDATVPAARVHTIGYVASWATGEWGACSVSCGGGGWQNRDVLATGWKADAPSVATPEASQGCNSQACTYTCGDYGMHDTRRDCLDSGWPSCEIRYRDRGDGELLTCWRGFE